ncbi:MAG: MMPL family transporter [Leptospirales bacterium]|nr:MMPL family transporter [Leptospirales bacterium]
MIRQRLRRFCVYYLSRPWRSLLVVMALLAVAVNGAMRLTIDSNQLNLLPASDPTVAESIRVARLLGGAGYLSVALRMKDRDAGDELFYRGLDLRRAGSRAEGDALLERARQEYRRLLPANRAQSQSLKQAAEELGALIQQMPDVQYASYKVELDLMRRKALYFVRTNDLREGFRRIGLKRDELVERASPFYVDLGQPGYRLDVGDLIDRYRTVGKKDISDEYNISIDKKMLVIGIKPVFGSDDLARSRDLIQRIQMAVTRLKLEDRGIETAFAGNYTLYVEGYDSIRNSLAPTTLIALAGVALVLAAFIRRIGAVVALMLGLLYSIAIAAGFTGYVLGQLNVLTSIFGGILAGFGIDFGIHLVYRIREELSEGLAFPEAVAQAIWHSGAAAAFSAATTIAAFATLIPSAFGGFSQLGLISAYGLLFTWLCMFFVTPIFLALMLKLQPGLLGDASARKVYARNEERLKHRLSGPRVVRITLISLMALLTIAALFASRVSFDGRASTMVDQSVPADRLTDELSVRFDVAGSPSVIALPDLDQTRALWEAMEPLTDEQRKSIAQVISPFTFVPPRTQQLENHRLMQKFLAESSAIPPGAVPEEYRGLYHYALSMINEPTFRIEDVPSSALAPFRQAPDVREEVWLTIIYPIIDQLDDAAGVQTFGKLIELVRFPVIGRQSIRDLAYFGPSFAASRGMALRGSRIPQPVAGIEGLDLSESDIQGALLVANLADESYLRRSVGLSQLAVQTLLNGRPFDSLQALQAHKLQGRAAGANSILAKFMEIVQRELRTILISSLLLTILMLAISVRRFSFTLIAMAPLAAGIVLTAGALGMFKISLNYFNIVVVPILFGYGVNSGIFIFHRYLECGDVFRTIYRTGAAALGSILTSLAGWGAIALTSHPGLRSMGLLAVAGLTAMMIATLIFLPALLRTLEPITPALRERAHQARLQARRHEEELAAQESAKI